MLEEVMRVFGGKLNCVPEEREFERKKYGNDC